MNATELLKKDHDAITQLFAEFESSESAEAKIDVFEEISEQLLMHARIEEEIFYPAVKKAGSSEAEAEVDEALQEHQQVKAMLKKLDGMAAEVDAEFAETMRALGKNVEPHVQEEENEIFATAKAARRRASGRVGERLQHEKAQLMGRGRRLGRGIRSRIDWRNGFGVSNHGRGQGRGQLQLYCFLNPSDTKERRKSQSGDGWQ